MTFQKYQLKVLLVIAVIFNVAQGDTKFLGTVKILGENVGRTETFSMDSNGDLVIQGSYDEQYAIPNDALNILKATIEYIADVNGNRVKYMLVKEPQYPSVALSPSSLKSLAG